MGMMNVLIAGGRWDCGSHGIMARRLRTTEIDCGYDTKTFGMINAIAAPARAVLPDHCSTWPKPSGV